MRTEEVVPDDGSRTLYTYNDAGLHVRTTASPASGRMYSHSEMGRAAYNVAQADPVLKRLLGNTGTPGPPREGSSKEDDWYNAGIFDAVVRIGCPIPPN